jgi:phage terminase large subunit-like protein
MYHKPPEPSRHPASIPRVPVGVDPPAGGGHDSVRG